MYNRYKKYFWPALTIALVIILLFCQWEGWEQPELQEVPTTDIRLINTFTGGKDNLQCEGGRDSNSFTPTPTCDGPLYVEIGRWFENVSYCEFPNPGAMKWDLYDSDYDLAKWFEIDYSPVNTMVPWNGDRVYNVVWDGSTPWRIEVQNNMHCFLNYEYEIRIYEECGSSTLTITDTPGIPGFELVLLGVAIIIFIGYKKVKKNDI